MLNVLTTFVRTEEREEKTDTTGMGKTLQEAPRVEPDLPSPENYVVKPSPKKNCVHPPQTKKCVEYQIYKEMEKTTLSIELKRIALIFIYVTKATFKNCEKQIIAN